MHLEKIAAGVKRNTNILKVVVPAALEREVPSGCELVDDVMGGSFTPSMCVLYTGVSGAGKTTLMMQMADAVTRTGAVCLYNSCEESPFQLRKTLRRLGATSGFIIGEDVMTDKVIEHAQLLAKKNPGRQLFVVVDSLQTQDDGFYENGYTNSMSCVRVTEKLADFAKTDIDGTGNYPIVVIIGQVKKDGEFEGRNRIKHVVDAHVHIHIDDQKKSETYGFRILAVTKNRFGCAQKALVLDMTPMGLIRVGEIERYA